MLIWREKHLRFPPQAQPGLSRQWSEGALKLDRQIGEFCPKLLVIGRVEEDPITRRCQTENRAIFHCPGDATNYLARERFSGRPQKALHATFDELLGEGLELGQGSFFHLTHYSQ